MSLIVNIHVHSMGYILIAAVGITFAAFVVYVIASYRIEADWQDYHDESDEPTGITIGEPDEAPGDNISMEDL